MSNLTTSSHQRQNILNNQFALQAAEQHLALGGVAYNGQTVFTKQQVTMLFDISDATVERYITSHGDELRTNGYLLLKGKKLKEFKDLVDVSLMNEGNKIPVKNDFPEVLKLDLITAFTSFNQERDTQ